MSAVGCIDFYDDNKSNYKIPCRGDYTIEAASLYARANEMNSTMSSNGEEEVSIEFLLSLCKQVGEIMMWAFHRKKTLKHKLCASDLVTDTDIQVEKLLLQRIGEAFPHHACFSEESAESPYKYLTDEPTWIVDPIDGTLNFVHSYPFIAVSIGFYRKSIGQIGVVYNPILEECFWSVKGHGAFLGNRRIHPSCVTNVEDALVCTYLGASKCKMLKDSVTTRRKQLLTEFEEVTRYNISILRASAQDIRASGCTSMDLCHVACGRSDAFVSIGGKEWDFAAGLLILQEAQAWATPMHGIKTRDTTELVGQRCIIASATKELGQRIADLVLVPRFDVRELEIKDS